MDNKIECAVCGKSFRRITRTHLVSHGMTTNDYKERFPDRSIVCAELAYDLGKASRNMPEDRRAEVSKQMSAMWKGVPKTAEQREQISARRKGVSWGKHTAEHREKMRIVSKRTMEERLANGWRPSPMTDEGKERFRNKVKESVANGTRKKPLGPNNNKGKKLNLSDEQRANRSRKRVEWLAKNPSKFTNTSLEIKFRNYLAERGIEFSQQYAIHDAKGSWIYDFFIPSLSLLVETDSEFYHRTRMQYNRDILKTKTAKVNGFNIVRISDKDWRPDEILAYDASQMDEHNIAIFMQRALFLELESENLRDRVVQ